MALQWNVERIRNYKTVCWLESGEMNPLTAALIHSSMSVGIGTITHDNAAEVYARTKILEAVNGHLLFKDGKPSPITFEDIESHIGLWTNIGFESRKEWAERWFVGHGDHLVKYGSKRKSESAIEAAEEKYDGAIDTSLTETYRRQFVHARKQHAEKLADKILGRTE